MGDSVIESAPAAAQAAPGTHQHGAPPARAADGQPSPAPARGERAVQLPGVPGGEAADAAPRGEAQAEASEIARLVERESPLAAFLPDPYLVTDGWGTIHYANAAACALFDRPARLLSRRPLAMLVANAARGRFRDGVQQLHRLAGGAGSWTVEFAGENGTTRPRTVVAQALHDGAGAVAGIRWLVRAAAAEAAAPAIASPAVRGASARPAAPDHALLAQVGAAREAKSNFLAAMSHELRTPLTAVLGYAELLGDGVAGPVTVAQRQHLARITAGGEQLLALVNEILDFSRADSGEATLGLAAVDGAALARDALAAVDAAADGKGLAVRVELPAGGIPMHTDGGKLRQILVTLLGNAVKFTDAGEVALTARGAAGQVLFEVRDTGPGIAQHDLERVFEPFWQVVQTATRRHGGTGLGLSLARTLARLLGGDVRVTSAPGRGSCFTLRLPAVLAAPGARSCAPAAAALAGPPRVPPPITALPR